MSSVSPHPPLSLTELRLRAAREATAGHDVRHVIWTFAKPVLIEYRVTGTLQVLEGMICPPSLLAPQRIIALPGTTSVIVSDVMANSISVIDVDSGVSRLLASPPTRSPVSGLSLMDDGSKCAVRTMDGGLWEIPFDGGEPSDLEGKESLVLLPCTGKVADFCLVGNGGTVVCVSADNSKIVAMSLKDRRPRKVTPPDSSSVSAICASFCGEEAVISDVDSRGVPRIMSVPLDGREARCIISGRGIRLFHGITVIKCAGSSLDGAIVGTCGMGGLMVIRPQFQ